MAPQFFKSLLALGALSAILSNAAPLNPAANKRDLIIETDTEIVYTTIDITITVDANGNTIGGVPAVAASTTLVASTPSAAPATSTTSAADDQFFAPAASSTTAVPTTSSSPAVQTPAYVAPAPAASTSTSQVATVPAVATEAPSSSYVAPPTTTSAPAPVDLAAAPASSAAAPSSSAASSGVNPSGQTYTGDITYYDVGLGACGITNQASDAVIALSWEFMGAQSNGNSYCTKQVMIKNGQYSATATVVDKCMGCDKYSIDLSDSLFSTLTGGDMGLGRVPNVEWYFTGE